jgi:hypothetical protein
MFVTQGGAYLLFWSAILFGAFQFLSGMRQMRAIDEALEVGGAVVVFGGCLTWQISAGSMPW